MAKAQDVLKEWIMNFIKNKDLIMKNLVSIEENKDGFDLIVEYKDKKQFFIINPIIEDINEILKKLDTEKHYGLVILNTASNFKIIVDTWDELVKFKHLCIYFINPFSNLDKKWIIYPHTHHRICDESSLKTGLKSMFDMVDQLSEKDLEVRFK